MGLLYLDAMQVSSDMEIMKVSGLTGKTFHKLVLLFPDVGQ